MTNTCRLALWSTFVLVLGGLGYATRFGFFGEDTKPPPDVLYRWETVGAQLVTYLIFLGVVLAISSGDPTRLALRRPLSWGHAIRLILAVAVLLWAAAALLEQVLHGGEEQGLTPSEWDASRAPAFAANAALVVLLLPIVEELIFRGLGFHLLGRYGDVAAIVLVGLAFGYWHGLVNAFPALAVVGFGLAFLRARTGSVYPSMVAHAAFNALALAGSLLT